MNEAEICGKICRTEENLSGGATVFWAYDSSDDPDIIAELVRERCALLPYRLIAFPVDDWNADLSPWRAGGVFRGQDFAGNGAETLGWLKRAAVGFERPMIAGYSLAGLFALWASCETELFSGAASCSGSVWYPGWSDYIKTHFPNAEHVYLSLGDREEKTRNHVMAQVGDNTRALAEKLGIEVVWNEGNHFKDADKRLAAGIARLIESYVSA